MCLTVKTNWTFTTSPSEFVNFHLGWPRISWCIVALRQKNKCQLECWINVHCLFTFNTECERARFANLQPSGHSYICMSLHTIIVLHYGVLVSGSVWVEPVLPQMQTFTLKWSINTPVCKFQTYSFLSLFNISVLLSPFAFCLASITSPHRLLGSFSALNFISFCLTVPSG